MMRTAILVTIAGAVVAAPIPSYASIRLRALRADGVLGPRREGRRAPSPSRHPLVTTVASALAAVLATILAVGPAVVSSRAHALVVPAVAAASIGAVAGWLATSAAAARRERRLLLSLGVVVTAVSAELRAGQSESAALRSAAAAAEPELARLLEVAGDVAAEAGDVAVALRESDDGSTLPASVRSGLLRVAAVWAASRDCGGPIASMLDRVDEDLRAHRRRSQQIDAQLAGPRATAVLLALLPGLGLALGAAAGADPVPVLVGTATGQLVLLVGVCLGLAGVVWTVRIVRAAGRSP